MAAWSILRTLSLLQMLNEYDPLLSSTLQHPVSIVSNHEIFEKLLCWGFEVQDGPLMQVPGAPQWPAKGLLNVVPGASELENY